MRPRQFLALAVLCGTVALTDWGAARLGVFGAPGIESTPTPNGDSGASRGATSSSTDAAGAVDALVAEIAEAEPLWLPAFELRGRSECFRRASWRARGDRIER